MKNKSIDKMKCIIFTATLKKSAEFRLQTKTTIGLHFPTLNRQMLKREGLSR